MNLIDRLYANKKTTVTEKELEGLIGSGDYASFAGEVGELVRKNVLAPVKSKKSGMNGRLPPLYNKYRIVREEKDYSGVLEEIKLLNPRLNIGGYLENPALYEKHGEVLGKLSDYLWRKGELLDEPMSQNERSLSIWGFEKLLGQKEALVAEILRFSGLECRDLHYFNTPEPFVEYVHAKADPMNILIIENKDTWFSFRRVMLETGRNRFLDTEMHALVYGEGRKIAGKTGRMDEYDLQWRHGSKNTYYYFGDLDYEGIQIYLDLKAHNGGVDIKPFKAAYLMLVLLAEGCDLPVSADRRNKTGRYSEFLEYFPQDTRGKMKIILENGRYIPQEILNYQVIKKNMKGT